MPIITNFATTDALTAVGNKKPDHSKYSSYYTKLAAEYFTATLKQANLATKDDIDDFIRNRFCWSTKKLK